MPPSAVALLAAATLLGGGPHWPLHHQDAWNTRAVDTAAPITAPALKWQRRVGGTKPQAITQDLDGDGDREVVLLVGGRAVARDPDTSALLWASPPLALGFFMPADDGHAVDMDGDGVPDILVSKANIGDTRIYALDGATGAVQWVFGEGLGPASGTNGQNRHWVGDVDGDGVPELVVFIPKNDTLNAIYAFDFSGGFDGDVLQWTASGHSYKGASRFSVADATGNGALEVLLHAGQELAVFAGATGELLSLTPAWHGPDDPIVYGVRPLHFQADADPAREFLFTWPKPGGFVGVWTLDPGTHEPVARWKLATSQSVWVAEPADVDGDGSGAQGAGVAEVVVSRHDGSSWRTTAFGGGDGVPKAWLDGWVVAGAIPRDAGGWTTRSVVADVDGDGRQEVAALLTAADPPPSLGSLNMLRLSADGATFEQAWSVPLVTASVAAVADLDGDGDDELVCYRDLNGDGTRDALQVVDGSGTSAKILATLAFTKAEARELLLMDEAELLAFATDGFIDTYDAELTPIGARVPTGGHAPSLLATPRTAGGPVQVMLRESAGRVIALTGGGGTPASPPATKTLFEAEERRELLAAVDTDGDGDVELLTRHAVDEAQVYELTSATGGTVWSEVLEGATAGLSAPPGTGGDLDGDGVLDFYLQTVFGGVLRGLPLSGATGLPLGWGWEPYQGGGGAGTVYSPALLHDLDGDGLADVLISRYLDRVEGSAGGSGGAPAGLHLLRGTDGEVLLADNYVSLPTRLLAAPVPPEGVAGGPFRLLYSVWGGRGSFALGPAPAPTLTGVFKQTEGGHLQPGHPVALDLTGDGAEDLIEHDAYTGAISATDALSGDLLWSRVLAGGALHADAQAAGSTTPLALGAVLLRSADGQHTVIWGDRDGRLYALDPSGPTLRWVYDLGFEIGSVIAADLDDDGVAELVASAGDGYVYALTQAADLGVIATVRDGTGDDVDLVETLDDGIHPGRFSASWDPPAGGSEATLGYLVRLVTDTGALVVDWVDVTAATAVTVTAGVHLVAGVTYRVVVLPYGASSSGTATASDGFELAPGLEAPGTEDLEPDAPPVADDPTPPSADSSTGSGPDGSGAEDAPAGDAGPLPDGASDGGDGQATGPDGAAPAAGGGCDCDAAGGRPDPLPGLALVLLWLVAITRSRRDCLGEVPADGADARPVSRSPR